MKILYYKYNYEIYSNMSVCLFVRLYAVLCPYSPVLNMRRETNNRRVGKVPQYLINVGGLINVGDSFFKKCIQSHAQIGKIDRYSFICCSLKPVTMKPFG